jgi:hypothetical protein
MGTRQWHGTDDGLGGNTALLITAPMQQPLHLLAPWTISGLGEQHHGVRMLGCGMLQSNTSHTGLDGNAQSC